MKIRAAILFQVNKPLVVEELSIPKLKRGQVLIKVAYSGICHSQLNEIAGFNGEDKYLPHTLGHEGSGEVVDTGPDVKKVKIGDQVVLTWIKAIGMTVSGTCYFRKDGSKINAGPVTTFSDYSIVSESRVVPIKKNIEFKAMALLGCAIPTGAGIAVNTAKVHSGSKVAIFGVGGIGLSAVIGCKLREAKTIIAVDIENHKLQLAQDLGCTHLINASQNDSLNKIFDITQGEGVDYAIEASGNKKVMETAFQSISKNGLCVVAGNLRQGKTISIDPMELIKGKRILGTWGGETKPDRDIPIYANLYQSNKIKLDKLLTQTYSLSDINQALEDMKKGKVIRAMINMALD
jgi:S-(hydroxymethyl)glutathione dehydrogenase / alcohol dehydrogenase